ncbi:unnamed protein product [Schistocephalus solidus]|uniref:Reverse transcriptase domain-containing protein n=1 Tax=Schistocephalus solidus TaxID=70667 RepID=A0A3P7D5K2_SCHSO|nr:unnamed protein product [Schistocephalus solidus]
MVHCPNTCRGYGVRILVRGSTTQIAVGRSICLVQVVNAPVAASNWYPIPTSGLLEVGFFPAATPRATVTTGGLLLEVGFFPAATPRATVTTGGLNQVRVSGVVCASTPSMSDYRTSHLAPLKKQSYEQHARTEDGTCRSGTGALKGDIAALSETRFSELGQLKRWVPTTPSSGAAGQRQSDATLVLPLPSGTTSWMDHAVWQGVLGPHGLGSCNDNGLLLLRTCAEHHLLLTNTFFRLPTREKATWMHPQLRRCHLLDYVLVRRRDQQDALKGNRQLCDNHRGISLLNIAGKIFARILLNRLNGHLEQDLLPKSGCGFRQHRGTTDMIFAARQLPEKCQEMRIHLYTTFVNLTKTFDTVNGDGLWKVIENFGCPEWFKQLVRQLHDGMTARVNDNGTVSEAFAVTNGVEQGCVFAPTLFSLTFSAMLMYAYRDEQPGISIAYRIDRHLLNSRRIQAATRVSTTTVYDLLFADDCTLNTVTEEDMQRSLDLFAEGCADFVLTISTEKHLSCTNRHPARNTMLPESMSKVLNSKT